MIPEVIEQIELKEMREIWKERASMTKKEQLEILREYSRQRRNANIGVLIAVVSYFFIGLIAGAIINSLFG